MLALLISLRTVTFRNFVAEESSNRCRRAGQSDTVAAVQDVNDTNYSYPYNCRQNIYIVGIHNFWFVYVMEL